MTRRTIIGVVLLAGITATGCVDLEVLNPNAADAARALVTGEDIEALIGGGFGSWWNCQQSTNGPAGILSTVTYQHSATAANFGMVQFSGWPKEPAHYRASDVYYGNNVGYCWTQLYRGVSAVVDGLRALEAGSATLPDDQLARAVAFGNFVLGLAHGSSSILYDQGYVYDQSMEPEEVELVPYAEVGAAAQGYFDKAIAAASGKTFEVPVTWMSVTASAADLVRLAYSYKAQYRAVLARTPAERAAVNWATVASDVDKGITATWGLDMTSGSGKFQNTAYNQARLGAWGQLSYQVFGMADTSGRYQRWIAKDPAVRHPNLSDDQTGDPFLIMTPDLRFPQGSTVAEQSVTANRGKIFHIYTGSGGYSIGWLRPDRGTFRWSYYRDWTMDYLLSTANRAGRIYPELTVQAMDLLKAEALFRTGQQGAAATLVNKTRTAAGLNATDAAGTNTSCVPKLPNGQCGDLLEMLKWEIRLETKHKGLGMAPWYFHGRGWGDLPEGVFLQLPVPGRELELLGLPAYTFGGAGGESSAPVGTYGY